MSLAIVINTTDKYSHIWDAWYYYFSKLWTLDYPVYFLNEKKDITFPFKQIKVDIPEVGLWTKKLRESVKQIPEDNLFILLEDLFMTDCFDKGEFEYIYQCFCIGDCDAMRIQPKSKYTTVRQTKLNGISKLDDYSDYLIAHTPNIWRKDFLLECISRDEDPWTNELVGTIRMQGQGYDIYHYEKDWFVNVLRHGRVQPQYSHLLDV